MLYKNEAPSSEASSEKAESDSDSEPIKTEFKE
jgi:hypothetical protein